MLVDDREEPALLQQLERFGMPASSCRLDYADVVIESCDGRIIGFERKRIHDLINSMEDRRLSGSQLKGMHATYDRVELIVESIYRPGENGEIEVPGRSGWQPLFWRGGGISYRQVDSYLYSQYECGGVAIWRTGYVQETAQLLVSRWHWWQKPYHLHKSHDTIYTNNPAAQRRGAVMLHQGEANPVTLLAAQIPGLDAKAWDVGKYFSSPFEMVAASVDDWRRCPWTDRSGNVKHFGKETAREIVAWLKGKYAK